MMAGLLLIAFGVLVALVPQILVVIVSTVFIATGTVLCLLIWRWRKLRRSSQTPLMNWFIRW
ncbi:MAG: hypothetical protein HYZ92_04195 [Candidatus Omnitrophica bacterium]|nr:hypothetical protein [Candidatus Omnitrophota bacterium]